MKKLQPPKKPAPKPPKRPSLKTNKAVIWAFGGYCFATGVVLLAALFKPQWFHAPLIVLNSASMAYYYCELTQ